MKNKPETTEAGCLWEGGKDGQAGRMGTEEYG